MMGILLLTCLHVSLIGLGSVTSMPAPSAHGHHRQGSLDSIANCNEEQRKLISSQLEHAFKKEMPSSDMTLPPSETSVHVFISVTYNVFNTKISKFALESSELTSEGDMPAWKISKASVKVEGQYKYSHAFSSDSGTYVLTMDHVRMYMIGNKCQIDLGQSNKRFSGSTANWGYNTYIKGTSKDDDNRDLKEKLCHYVKKIFHEVLTKTQCQPKTTTTVVTPGIDVAPSGSAGISVPSNDDDGHEKKVEHKPGVEKDDGPDVKESTNDPSRIEVTPRPAGGKEEIHEPILSTRYAKTTTTTTAWWPDTFHHDDDYSISNDEPLDIPGYLPFVDPHEQHKSQAKGSPNSASTFSNLVLHLTVAAFASLYVLLSRHTFSFCS